MMAQICWKRLLSAFFHWLPTRVGVVLVVVAALAAFASMANAGIMAASRFPFAMARDRLLPDALAAIGRFQTPVVSIVATSAFMALLLVVLDVEKVVKVASTFKLLIFMLVNVSVIVMREKIISINLFVDLYYEYLCYH